MIMAQYKAYLTSITIYINKIVLNGTGNTNVLNFDILDKKGEDISQPPQDQKSFINKPEFPLTTLTFTIYK